MADSDLNEVSAGLRELKTAVTYGQKETGRRFGELKDDIRNIEKKIDDQNNVSMAAFEEYKKDVRLSFVTIEAHNATIKRTAFVEKIVFGFVGLIAVAVITAVIRSVLVS